MRPCDSVCGHPLHAVHARFVLEDAVCAVALDGEGDLFEAARGRIAVAERLGLEAPPLRVLGEHAVQVAGEQRRFVAPGASPDLDDHVLVVERIALHHREAQLLGDLLHLGAGADELVLHLLLALVQQLLRARRVALGHPVLLRQLVRNAELAMAARDVRVTVAVGDHVWVRELLLQLAVALLDLLDEPLDDCGCCRHGRA